MAMKVLVAAVMLGTALAAPPRFLSKLPKITRSGVPGCPAENVDCGVCQCVPRSSCQWCPAGTASGPADEPSGKGPKATPSTIEGCPTKNVDCGVCSCVPRGTCQWCPSGPAALIAKTVEGETPAGEMPEGETPAGEMPEGEMPESKMPESEMPEGEDVKALIAMKPSSVPGCPEGNVDCGTCMCVPKGSCQWCPAGDSTPATGKRAGTKPTRSTIEGCPTTNFDCGVCSCVPESVCKWCPEG